MENKKSSFTRTILITLILGLVSGLSVIILREALTNHGLSQVWHQINQVLFADITAVGNEQALGIFYIIGQVFLRLLQLLLIPLIFTSIIRAIHHIQDTKLLNQLAKKGFTSFTVLLGSALLFGVIVGFSAYTLGWFELSIVDSIPITEGTVNNSNPLNIILNAFQPNILGALSSNSNVIATVVIALGLGVLTQSMRDQVQTFIKLIDELYHLTMKALNIVITRFAPIAIYTLLVRTFAAYGIQYLAPALVYMLLTTFTLLIFAGVFLPIYVYLKTGIKPLVYLKKVYPVIAFGFSTSSSAATLPLAQETVIQELGVPQSVASFIVPLGSTINMTGTAIMQIIATLFIASVAGYEITAMSLLSIGALTIIGSISTPAAPGAGAILLFTIISGMGFTSPIALAAYSFILAINRPVEMLVTAVNVMDDTVSALTIASSLDNPQPNMALKDATAQ